MGFMAAGKLVIAAAAVAAASLGTGMGAHAQDKLKVIVFPGLSNLAQFAAEAQGFYKKRNLAVEVIYTPNSDELRKGLAEGRYDIAHGGVDNAVAQVENDKTDLFIFMGGNSGLNSLFVQPEIKSYEQLRGTTMAVDAPNTAFALLLYKMLDVKGIKRSDYKVAPVGATHLRLAAMLKDKTYSAAMLSPPGSIQAAKAGLKDLGSAVSVVGPYQSDGGWVLRSWGKANADTLNRYIAGEYRGHPLGAQSRQPRRADSRRRRAAEAAARGGRGIAQGRRRSEGFRHRRALRYRRLPQCAASCAPTCSAPGAARRRRRTNISTSRTTTAR